MATLTRSQQQTAMLGQLLSRAVNGEKLREVPCAYCSKMFIPPLIREHKWNDPKDPGSLPGWMLFYCSRICAALGMPDTWGDDTHLYPDLP